LSQVYVVFKTPIINPDTQDPLFRKGDVWRFDHAVEISAVYGIDNWEVHVCIGADVAKKMVDVQID
jgi:hypothetical protein